MAGRGGNGNTLRQATMEAVRDKVKRLAAEGRTAEEIEAALAGDDLTELERDVAYLLVNYEVRRGSDAKKDAPGGYREDIERDIGG